MQYFGVFQVGTTQGQTGDPQPVRLRVSQT